MHPYLSEKIAQVLEICPYFQGTALRFNVNGQKVLLKGAVLSFFHKQKIQEAVRKIEGIQEIQNDIIVSPSLSSSLFSRENEKIQINRPLQSISFSSAVSPLPFFPDSPIPKPQSETGEIIQATKNTANRNAFQTCLIGE